MSTGGNNDFIEVIFHTNNTTNEANLPSEEEGGGCEVFTPGEKKKVVLMNNNTFYEHLSIVNICLILAEWQDCCLFDCKHFYNFN